MQIPRPSSPVEFAVVAVGGVAALLLLPLVPLAVDYVVGILATVFRVITGLDGRPTGH